jgi:hypothetical protein
VRRPLLFLPIIAAVLAAVALTAPGDGARPGRGADGSAPASYSAGVSSGRAPTPAATANWGNRSAAASADPARWEEPDGADAARRERVRMRRRLARLVLVSGAERLGVRPAELRRAVHTVLRAQRRAGRPAGAELGRLRDELAAALGRELGLGRAEVLRAARAELGARLLLGTGMGIVSDAGRRLALDCFDAPATCDVPALRRELRFARLLGR